MPPSPPSELGPDQPAEPPASGRSVRPLRIAVVLPEPRRSGGVPGTALLLAKGLVADGHDIDVYTVADFAGSAALMEAEGIHTTAIGTGFKWGQWYSRRRMTAHLTQLVTRAVASARLATRVVRAHRRKPYDVLYRFSTIELLGLGLFASRLPPIVVHPEVHAAGELAAMIRERSLAARCESRSRRVLAETIQRLRRTRQRRALRSVSGVIAPSAVFAEHLARDYDLDRAIVSTAPNPVDLDLFSPPTRVAATGSDAPPPWRLLFVGRISVRKGIDQLVELSHLLDDLAGHVQLDIVGPPTLWSDYRPLLDGCNPRVATYLGDASHADMPALLGSADLLVQPSTYEPFAITVAEGLASGVPVVATTEVGASEEIDPTCCIRVAPGRADELADAVRAMVDRLDAGERTHLGTLARSEAERLFSVSRAARLVGDALTLAAARRRPS